MELSNYIKLLTINNVKAHVQRFVVFDLLYRTG